MDERRQDEERYRALRAGLVHSAAGPVEGLFGPHSGAWEILRELAIAFGGGRALLLQLAHPAVSSAVRQHSNYREDLLGRTLRTFDAVYRIVFGDLDTALGIADRVHARHRSVKGVIDSGPVGVKYRALDPELLFWVQATLIDTSFEVYELLVRPLSGAQRERFYAETLRFSAAFGIPPEVPPPTYADFKQYLARMVAGGALRVGHAERALREQLIATGNMTTFLSGLLMADDPKPIDLLFAVPGLSRATRAMFEVATAAMLPEPLAHAYGLRFGRRERAEMATVVRGLKLSLKVTPPALRYVPIFHEAMARVAAARGEPQPIHGRAHRWLWSLARAGAARLPVKRAA